MFLSNIFVALVQVFAPVIIVYTFCVILIDIVKRAFWGR